MTGQLIKSEAVSRGQIGSVALETAGREDMIASLRRRVGTLEARLSERDAQVGAFEQQRRQAFQAGREEGVTAGRASAADDDAARLAALEAGVEHAVAAVNHRLDDLEPLAAALARDVLERILTDPDERVALVEQLLARQLRVLRREAVLRVELSAADFADAAAASERLHRLEPRPEVAVTADVPPGGCVLKLRLGTLAIGLDQQWPALRALLDRMAAGER